MTQTTAPVIQEHRFPCEACGSDYRFAPGEGALICDHCGNRQQIAPPGPWSGALKELDFNAALSQTLPA
jgi:hypothetical protein